MKIAGGLLGGEAKGGSAEYEYEKSDTIAYMNGYDARIVASVRSLASKGIVRADDFKTFPFGGVPKRIEEIFAGTKVKSHICG
jgi:hypothetical protein